MKKALTLLVTAFLIPGLLSPLSAQTLSKESFQGREVVAGQIIVRFRVQSPAQGQALASQDADVVSAEALGSTGATLLRSRGRNVAQLLQAYQGRADVLYAEPDYIWQVSDLPNDFFFGQQWAFRNTGQSVEGRVGTAGADIRATAAWDITEGTRSFVIGVVDTGIEYNHPDLAPNMWSAPSAFSVVVGGQTIHCAAGTHGFDAISRTCDPIADTVGHGTHVAGIIGSAGNNGQGVAGVSRIASMMSIKFLGPSGGTTADAIAALEFARQVKAAFGGSGGAADIRILNNSWGGPNFSQALLDEISRTGDSTNNMLFLAAAGNSGIDTDVTSNYPSSFGSSPYNVASVVSIAATNNLDGLATFSNFGAISVHLAAPGESIVSAMPAMGYRFSSGTSMATPMVAGVAGLVLSGCSTLTLAGLKSVLLDPVSLDAIPALAGKTFTGGRLNALKALQKCGASAPASTFRLTATQGFNTIGSPGQVTSTITMTPTGSFSGTVALSVTASSGIVASLNTSSVTTASPTATLTVTANFGTSPGTYLIGVTGLGGAIMQTTGVVFTVVPPISPGTGVTGTLSSTDPSSPSRIGSYADLYELKLNALTDVLIDLKSVPITVDTYLYLLDSAGAIIAEDDDSGTDFDSTISRTLAPGTYYLDATSFSSGDTGAYRLSINVPTLLSISPSGGAPGTIVPVTLTGTRLNSGSLAVHAGADISVSAVNSISATTATATFTIAAAAPPGPRDVTVSNSEGTSHPIPFNVLPAPVLSSVIPNLLNQGSASMLSLSGANFAAPMSMDAGPGITFANINVASLTSATATATVSPTAPLGLHSLTLTTSAGTSNASTVTVRPPLPTLTSIAPDTASQGAILGVTLVGTGFLDPFSVNVFPGGVIANDATAQSATLATATFSVSGVAAPGQYSVRAATSAGLSAPLMFTVTAAPPPTFTSINPSSGGQGSFARVTLVGSNLFAPIISVSGTGVTTLVEGTNPSLLTATFIIAADAPLGARSVMVTTPGGTTGPVTFNVVPKPPELTGIFPSTGVQGSTFNVTLLGRDFAPGLIVNAGPDITVNNVNLTSIFAATATFIVGGTASPGSRSITITTALGTSNAVPFDVVPLPPTLTGVSPASGVRGASLGITLTGTNFVSGLTASAAGLVIHSINVVDLATATASVDISPGATLGARSLTVTTPGGTSGAVTFTVLPPSPTVTQIAPNAAVRGTSVNVTLTGTDFLAGTTVANIPGVTVSNTVVVSSSSMTATFTLAAGMPLGAHNVAVTSSAGTSLPMVFTVADPFPDVSISSTHTGNFGVGFDESYIVTVSNAGLVNAAGAITVTDALPAGMTFVSGIGTGWACANPAAQTVTCIADAMLIQGGPASFTLRVRVGSSAAGNRTHMPTVAVAGDLNTANDVAADPTIVVATPSPVVAVTPFISSGQQEAVAVTIATPFPHDVTGKLTLAFSPEPGISIDDPAIRFATGSRTVNFTIAANTLQARFESLAQAGPVGFQTGTVAGALTLAGDFTAGTVTGTFSAPFGTWTFLIVPSAPRISDVQVSRQNGFAALISLFSTSRQVTSITLMFQTTPAVQLSCGTLPDCSVSENQLTLGVRPIFQSWFDSPASQVLGSLSILRVPFAIEGGTVSGDVVVTLSNTRGRSNPMSFRLP